MELTTKGKWWFHRTKRIRAVPSNLLRAPESKVNYLRIENANEMWGSESHRLLRIIRQRKKRLFLRGSKECHARQKGKLGLKLFHNWYKEMLCAGNSEIAVCLHLGIIIIVNYLINPNLQIRSLGFTIASGQVSSVIAPTDIREKPTVRMKSLTK